MMADDAPIQAGQAARHVRLPGHDGWKRSLVAAVLLAIFFVIAARTFSLRNGFSYRFHPDEHTKARQIQTGQYNFYHPQLLLRGAQALLLVRTGAIDGRIGEEPSDKLEVPLYNRILQSARTASALFGAGAVVLLALVAWRQRGRAVGIEARGPESEVGTEEVPDLGATAARETAPFDSMRGLGALVLVAISLIACPSLFANAHFAKEDAALVFGMAAWIATGAWFISRPAFERAMLFAAACGLVVSAKWIGGVLTATGLVIIAIVAIRQARRRRESANAEGGNLLPGARQRQAAAIWAAAALVAVLVVLLVNAPILWQFTGFIEGLKYEAAHVTSDHQGLIANAPAYYLRQLRIELGWPLAVLAIFELAATAAIARRRRRAELWIAPLAALVLFLTICSTKVVFPRYLLPVTVLGHYFAALGALTLAELLAAAFTRQRGVATRLPGAFTSVIALLVLVMSIVPHIRSEVGMLHHFGNDNRESLQAWAIDPARTPPGARITEAIGSGARVMQEHHVGMERWAVPFTLHSVRSVAYRLADEQGIDGSIQAGPRSIEDLVAAGYTHVAIGEDRYRRFFDTRLRPTPEFKAEYWQVRAMYERLLNGDGVTLIYEYNPPPHRPEWINPAVRIYRLPEQPPNGQ